MNELIKEFDDFVSDYPRMIESNSCVALRHIATGRYLSSCNKKYYKSNNQVVYCGDPVLNNDALWIINANNLTNLKACENSITLRHKFYSNNYLSVYYDESSNTACYKACCNNKCLTWTLQHIKNERNYLKSHDNVLLKMSFDENKTIKILTLRSHEINFEIDNNIYQEVFTHENRIGGIDEWCIELIK
ncbi:hypothetical protein C1645_768245 [Glomus cerebriforme]|uniref:MIR domain-containing protein n=1 Tax=Glomus cerebriforme TaxID=658196 RepID=A0A397T7P1_9GLOM|nr:hypothetical protein C1645_768245 [Glomus cerebriforme]